MLVREIMRVDVKTISDGATVKAAAQAMVEHDVGSLLVLDKNEEVIGIITEGDVLKKFATTDKMSKDVRVSEIMTKKVIAIGPDALIEEAAELMNRFRIKKLPVLVRNRVVGIVTARELLGAESAIIDKLSSLFPLIEKKEGIGG